MMAVSVRPDAKAATIEELASWWAENADEIKAMDGFMWNAKRRLREALRDQGVIDTPAGRLTLGTDKFEYDSDALIQQFPEVGLHSVEVKCATAELAEQVISYALESGWNPDDVDHSMRPDTRLVNKLIKTIAPEKAAALLSLRTANGKIEVGA